MKNIIIASLIALLAVGGTLGALAATRTVDTTAKVEVTVWESVRTGNLYLSTAPEGGEYTTHDTPIDMSQLSASGRFRQGSAIVVEVPVSVEVEVPDEGAGDDPPAAIGDWQIGFSADRSDWGYLAYGDHDESRGGRPGLAVICEASEGLAVFFQTHSQLADDRVSFSYRLGRTAVWEEFALDEVHEGEGWRVAVLEAPAPEVFVSGLLRAWSRDNFSDGAELAFVAHDDHDNYRGSIPIDGLAGALEFLPCWAGPPETRPETINEWFRNDYGYSVSGEADDGTLATFVLTCAASTDDTPGVVLHGSSERRLAGNRVDVTYRLNAVATEEGPAAPAEEATEVWQAFPESEQLMVYTFTPAEFFSWVIEWIESNDYPESVELQLTAADTDDDTADYTAVFPVAGIDEALSHVPCWN